MAYNLDDLDQHMANLRSTLHFFTESLERTDHNSPDWLAPDLISLRNQSGRLQESMQNFRAQLLTTGLAENKVASHPVAPQPSFGNSLPQTPKPSTSRLSLEGTFRPSPASTPLPPSPQTQSRVPTPIAAPRAETTSPKEEEYAGQKVDVTEEVQRRLREARLRRLMDTPSTSHKRKFGAYEALESEGGEEGANAGGEGAEQEVWTARKRVRASGSFEPVAGLAKRKEGGITMGWEEVGKDVRGRTKRARRL